MKKIWTPQDKKFIIKNYPNNGTEYCAQKLNTTYYSIRYIVSQLKIKLNDFGKKNTNNIATNKKLKNIIHKVDEKLFMVNFNKFSVYILGLLWADGSIDEKHGIIRLACVKEDMLIYKPYLELCGKWSYLEINRDTGRTQICAWTSNRRLVNFLAKNNYKNKSCKSPIILNIIPKNLKKYFFRGWIDGDGCFYVNKKSNCNQFSLASSFEQDWSYFTSIIEKLKIRYSINRRVIKKTKEKTYRGSAIRINSKDGIFKLGNYIYENFDSDTIGLKRKYEKYLSIFN